LGHWARECKSKAKKDQAHTVQVLQASLVVARVTEFQNSVKEESLVVIARGELAAGLVVHEEKVFVQLARLEADLDANVCIIDTGATNHMIGSHVAFVVLHTLVQGTIRFDDDSTAEIEGCRRVELIYKNGELRSFNGVYFIPKVMANIVSVGHLNKDGYQLHIRGRELAIREPEGKLLARVRRVDNRLYLLLMKL
jgi:hypothetical protein